MEGVNADTTLSCGVRFCGGCNPRYERGGALESLKAEFKGRVNFEIAEENAEYDLLLVIGGCTNCCASYEGYVSRLATLKMWDEACLEGISLKIAKIIGGDHGL